jgi:hypothetical protein
LGQREQPGRMGQPRRSKPNQIENDLRLHEMRCLKLNNIRSLDALDEFGF